MIDMTLCELLKGLDLSDAEITAELENYGAQPETYPAAVVTTELGKEKPAE